MLGQPAPHRSHALSRSIKPAESQWSWILVNERFHYILFTKKATYQELSLLPRGSVQVVEPSPPVITITKKFIRLSSNQAGRQAGTMLGESSNRAGHPAVTMLGETLICTVIDFFIVKIFLCKQNLYKNIILKNYSIVNFLNNASRPPCSRSEK